MLTPLQSFYLIRFNDCDPYGHLNNARYLDYMINAREDHLRQAYSLSLSEFARKGIGWVTTRNEIQYVRPAFYNERVCIQSALLDVNESELLVEVIMYDESRQQLKALLWITFTHVSIKTSRRELHSQEILSTLSGMKAEDIDAKEGFRARLAALLAQIKENNNVTGVS